MSEEDSRTQPSGENSCDSRDESVKDSLLAKLEDRAKELAKKQVYQEDRYRNVDRTNSKQRKRMDARISDVKQMIYKRLLEKAFTEGNPCYDEDITADLEYICNRKYEENKYLREDNEQLQSEYESLLETHNKLLSKVEEANLKIDTLKVQHVDLIKNRDKRITELESSFGASIRHSDKLRSENEQASLTINQLREANKRLLSSPIITAKAFQEFITKTSTSLEEDLASRADRTEISGISDENDSRDPVDLSCIVIDNSCPNSTPKHLNDSVEEFFSPKRKIIPSNNDETPSKRFRRLRLEVFISPKESQSNQSFINIPVLMPSVTLPESVHIENKIERDRNS